MATAAPRAQTSIYETTLDEPDVEKALEQREQLRQKKASLLKDWKEADEAAKTALRALDRGVEAPVRIGRFVVQLRSVAGRVVSFEAAPTERFQISLLNEGD